MTLRWREEPFDGWKQLEKALLGPVGKEHRIERAVRARRRIAQGVDVHRPVQRNEATERDELQASG